jgi:ketosteroid isomerase-like protein
MITPTLAQQVAQTWLDDWNRHDLDAIMAHYADDIVFSSPFIVKLIGLSNGTIQGKAVLRDYFTQGLAAFPDLRFTLIQLLVGVDSVVLYYHSVNGLNAAEVMTLNDSGLVLQVTAHYSLVETSA